MAWEGPYKMMECGRPQKGLFTIWAYDGHHPWGIPVMPNDGYSTPCPDGGSSMGDPPRGYPQGGISMDTHGGGILHGGYHMEVLSPMGHAACPMEDPCGASPIGDPPWGIPHREFPWGDLP